MFNKKPVTDQFSNEALGKFLESLQWKHIDDTVKETAYEFIHIRSIEKTSIIWARIIASMDKFTISSYGYRVQGNRLERYSRNIKYQGNVNPLIRISKPVILKIKKNVKGGIVTHID